MEFSLPRKVAFRLGGRKTKCGIGALGPSLRTDVLEPNAAPGSDARACAARNFRSLRRRGITIRKTIGLLIGTWCIEHRRPLLHNDSDFQPMARHLGLIELPVTP